MLKYPIPALHFAPSMDIDWSSPPSDLIRFRENSRPAELLEQPYFIAQTGKKTLAFIADPAAAYEILVTRTNAFPKSIVQQRLGNQAFGPGLSGTLGQQNERQRDAFKTLVSARQAQLVKEVSIDATADAISRWLEQGSIDLYREMSELALQITWATLFGNNHYEGRDMAVKETIDALHKVDKSDFVASAKVVARLTQHFMESGRWQRLTDDNPLRAIANEAGWAPSPGLSQQEVKANALVFAASGHTTTGITMAWSAWLLGLHPELQQQLATGIRLRPDGEYERRTVRNLINESLRLFPPGPEVMRDAKESITIRGTEIPAGSMLMVSIYFLHRHKTLWENPDLFDPERFSPDRAQAITKGSFLPFSGGDYGCSGMSIAFAEMTSVLSQLLSKVQLDVDPADAQKLMLETGICLYPKSELRCKISLRGE